MYSRISAICLLTFVLGLSPLWAQRGALTVPVNLAQLSDRANVIVLGSIASAHVEPHPDYPHLMTVRVTVKVRESWKGQPSATYTFRQFIWDIRDRMNAAGYRKGDDVLFFMNPTNKYGLTAPVGLEQGRFRVIHEQDGSIRVANGRNNAGLLRQTAPRLKTGAASVAAMSV